MRNQENLSMSSKICLVASLAMFIAGCGGGGSGSTAGAGGAANNVSPTSPTDTTPVIVTSVPASTYGDEDLKAFNLLNAERDRCGFGKLAQNAKLDVMAKGHANWLAVNTGWSHYQTAGTPGFTGVTPEDRATNAGYGPNALVSEGMGSNLVSANDSRGVRGLLSAPYHQLDMLRGYREIGVGILPAGNPNRYIVLNYGTLPPDVAQAPIANTVRTYPCDGSNGVRRLLNGESPSPVPDRGLGINPLGTSIAVIGDVGKQMTITGASMTGPGGLAVTLRTPSNSLTDPNKGYLLTNEAYVMADAPLATSTTYQVLVTGTNGTMPFSRSFSFTTTSFDY